jgi:hypothetical protein
MLRVLILLGFFLYTGLANAGMSVPRTVGDVVWAIGLTRDVPVEVRREWAKAIIKESTAHGVDPFTMVAIIRNESRFNPAAVDAAGECIGFAQYCLTNIPVCRKNLQAAECLSKKAALLNWRYALSQLGADISRWREYCRKVTGLPALFARWLAGYQGAYARDKQVVCGMKKVRGKWRDVPRRAVTARVMNYRLTLDKQNRRRAR